MSSYHDPHFRSMIACLLGPVFALALASAPAHATVVIPLTFETMVSVSDLIVDGTVIDLTSRWSDDYRTIYTFVTIDVHEVVKGQLERASQLTLRFEGGEADGYVLFTASLPTFHRGERDIFLVSRNGLAISPLVGFFQGRFRVIGGRVYDHAGTPILGIRDGSTIRPTPSPVAAEQQSAVPSPGEAANGPYYYGPLRADSATTEVGNLSEGALPKPPAYAPIASRESPSGTRAAVPPPTPQRPAPSAVPAQSKLPSVAIASGEPMTLVAMIQEIRKAIH